MSIISAYIVYIFREGEKLISGYTSDIDNTLAEYTKSGQNTNLVFQQHFDDPDKAKTFARDLKKWDRQKKEALINGTIKFS